MADAHPVLYRRIEAGPAANSSLQLNVAYPSGSDTAFVNAMLPVMLAENLVAGDYTRRHTEGFGLLSWVVREYSPEHAASQCGVTAQDIVTAARWFGKSRASLSL